MTWAIVGRWLWSIASFAIPVPLALIAAIYAWTVIDKTSAVRRAVDKAVTDMVSGAQIEALKAQLAEEIRLRALVDQRVAALEEANQEHEAALEAEAAEKERLDNELDALKSRPAPPACDVTDDIFKQLRLK